ncbi:IclR family transcriptional regulator [Leifsonia sp. F6_8S_P_1B]|uniref:IclR family transcriptional regulator n=1 Tax=Leifsonia williamsii TaxID=3035919 RepID=A0ABT8K7F2_9MICO|nr:IclR family transcriptional regulator [Leifsonia williamsii]MDN4612943.1 IclR family transcriptional regulator [Leifsonia williamsii]
MTTIEQTAAEDDPRRKGPDGLRALDRAMSILFLLASRPQGISLAEIARETGITLSTVHRMVGALRERRLVRETPNGMQALGPASLVLARGFLGGLDFRVEALPVMSELRERTGEAIHLGTLASPHIVFVDKLETVHAVRTASRIGGTAPAVLTSLGRAILAYSPQPVVDSVREATINLLGREIAADVLEAVLRDTRERGYAVDREENEPGVDCVGAPIFDDTGRVIAAISVSVPAERFDDQRMAVIGELVADAARRVSSAIGHQGPIG